MGTLERKRCWKHVHFWHLKEYKSFPAVLLYKVWIWGNIRSQCSSELTGAVLRLKHTRCITSFLPVATNCQILNESTYSSVQGHLVKQLVQYYYYSCNNSVCKYSFKPVGATTLGMGRVSSAPDRLHAGWGDRPTGKMCKTASGHVPLRNSGLVQLVCGWM